MVEVSEAQRCVGRDDYLMVPWRPEFCEPFNLMFPFELVLVFNYIYVQ